MTYYQVIPLWHYMLHSLGEMKKKQAIVFPLGVTLNKVTQSQSSPLITWENQSTSYIAACYVVPGSAKPRLTFSSVSFL